MINHVWTIVCSSAVVDQVTNNISIFNVLENISVRTDPLPDGWIKMDFIVVSFLERQDVNKPAKGKIKLSFIPPSNEVLEAFESDVDLTEFTFARGLVRFDRLPLRESGRHYFKVELQIAGEEEWRNVEMIPILVNFAPKETKEVDLD
jgi:hypothetical protein